MRRLPSLPLARLLSPDVADEDLGETLDLDDEGEDELFRFFVFLFFCKPPDGALSPPEFRPLLLLPPPPPVPPRVLVRAVWSTCFCFCFGRGPRIEPPSGPGAGETPLQVGGVGSIAKFLV